MRQATTTPALALALLIVGSSAMARDTNFQPVPSPTGGPTSETDALLHSERARELQEIVDLTLKGDKAGAQELYDAYRKKYNPPPMGVYPGAQAQPAPRRTPYQGTPLVLPPEAR